MISAPVFGNYESLERAVGSGLVVLHSFESLGKILRDENDQAIIDKRNDVVAVLIRPSRFERGVVDIPGRWYFKVEYYGPGKV